MLKPLVRSGLLFITASAFIPTAYAVNNARIVIEAPQCSRVELPGKTASVNEINAFNRNYKIYTECMKKYADEQKSIASAYIEAANKAIREYNEYVSTLQTRIEALRN